MEDVGKRSVSFGRLFQFFLCGCCIVNSVGLAATQGTIGQTSIGSVSISVHIPRTVRLLAEDADSGQTSYCLRVIDTGAPAGSHYYRVSSNDEFESHWLRLQNIYGMNKEQLPPCNTRQVAQTNNSSARSTNETVLMLVPE